MPSYYYYFQLDVAFGRVYAITAPFVLKLKRAAQFFINNETVAIHHNRQTVSEPSFFK